MASLTAVWLLAIDVELRILLPVVLKRYRATDDGVPPSAPGATKLLAAFFIDVISLLLIDVEVSKTIAMLRPQLLGKAGLLRMSAKAFCAVLVVVVVEPPT